MKPSKCINPFCVLRIAAAAALPLFGHHSIDASFDSAKAKAIQGIVTSIIWASPHVNLTMQVKNANGAIAIWNVGIGAPNALYKQGFRKDSIEPLKTYSMLIWPARDGSNTATGVTLIFPNSFDVRDVWFMAPAR